MTQRGLADDEAFVTLAQDVDEITKVAKRAAALTHQLLIFSRRKVVQPEVLDLNAIVGEMEGLLRRTIGENVDRCERCSLPTCRLIKADRGQIDQVVMNLAVNARDAMPGGGELEIETAALRGRRGRTPASRDSSRAPTSGSRSPTPGTGMTPSVAARAFEPFFTTKPKGEGTGLGPGDGLRHRDAGRRRRDHRLRARRGHDDPSRPPGDDRDATQSPRPGAEPADPRPTARPCCWSRTRRSCASRRDGCSARTATRCSPLPTPTRRWRSCDGTRARIDLLLTDVVMPGRSGKELSTEVIEQRPAIKVLFMSGYSQDVIVHQGVLDAGRQPDREAVLRRRPAAQGPRGPGWRRVSAWRPGRLPSGLSIDDDDDFRRSHVRILANARYSLCRGGRAAQHGVVA